ncbi:MAG: hypothetical protein QXJ74_00885 [Nitrososphaera sp.]|nr:hypothetical protein [Nitrososphaera sp.]NWG37465.1 hypothetical protein [Nitrososphaera sp.]
MADSLMSYAIVVGIGVFLAGVLFGTRYNRVRHAHKQAHGGGMSHSEAA